MYDQIKGEIGKIRRKYIESAEEIVSGYNRELSLSKDYEGRQLFELLQNADDEAAGSSGKVLITFDGKKLAVSNTGDAFSFRGVKSLLYPNASPKKVHAKKIGCKGLGFRSILTWSNVVTVASTDFSIQFSRKYAIEFLKEILEERPELKQEIKALSNEQWPIATLTCPRLLKDSALVKGYSTSIIMDCHEELVGEIESQIKNLEFEELVFLPNLKEVEIICNEYHKVFYKVVDGENVIIETNDKNTGHIECACWKLYKQNGTIKDENNKEKDYEFIIAYDSSVEHQGEVLYSYFKTDVKLGFPALIHGTFELTSDRNSLQKQSAVNKQLIPLLADFLVETAVSISEEQQECDYRPLSLVISSDMDLVLKNVYKFDELLREKVYEKKILPTISNEYISINDSPKYSDDDFASVLNPKVFSSLLKLSDDKFIERYLKNDLGIPFFDYSDFCSLINDDIEFYSMDDRIRLISLIESEYRFKVADIFPHLIIDSNGENIADSVKVYPFPNEEQIIALPEWVDIKFLNQNMEKKLYEELSLGNNRRNLVNRLSRYNLEEYSFDRLLRGVVNQIDDDMLTHEKCSDILNWLWKYYNLDDRQAIPDVRVMIICRDGVIRPAKECYVGNDFGNELGERLIGLYSENFVAFDKLNIECDDKNSIVGFLEWLGVSKYPRLVKKNLSYDERQEYVDTCYPLYVQRDNCWYEKNDFNSINHVTVGIFENIDVLFEKANFNDLIAWFILDDKIGSRINSDSEEKNTFSCIKGYPYKKIDERTVTSGYMKSYLKFYLANKKWIPNANGLKNIPKYCCFEDNMLEPFIIVPDVDYTYIKEIVGRACKKDVDAILSRIGVSDVFQEMDRSVIYQALYKLPELDPDCKKARALYRKIIRDGLTPEEYKKNNPDYDVFINAGRVAARKGGKKRYVAVADVRYADKKVFSDEILKSFNMFDIDARSGEDKVKKLFGVKPLKYTNVELVELPELHPFDDLFKKEYLRFLPYVYACRMGLKQAATDFRRLKSSKVILCNRVKIQYKFGEEQRVSELKDFETVYLRKSNIAYICVPKRFSTFEELKQIFEFADAVAELVTAILDVNEDKDFFRDLFRDSELIREKKMRSDRSDENLEMLTEARKKFNTEINARDEFWMTIAEVLKVPNIDITSCTADNLLEVLHMSSDCDEGVNYEDLSCNESIEKLISIFGTLEIDVDRYNGAAVHNIDATKYWRAKLNSKMQMYIKKYQAYLIKDLQDEEKCVELYDQYKEEYIFLEPTIPNSLFVNIDEIFKSECGLSFNALDQYSDTLIDELISAEEKKISQGDLDKLKIQYAPSKVEAYLVFGQIEKLLNPETTEASKAQDMQADDNGLKERIEKVISLPAQGLNDVGTEAVVNEETTTDVGHHRKHIKRIHSETTDRKKQEIGMIGEAYVYKELLGLYPDVRWVSGNAEQAGLIVKGDDTCGYDIKYTDSKGMIQYVEVKSSRSEDIAFNLSDSELQFGCQNASSYEIIYVVIGDDGLPVHKPWRLGHLFKFAEGEDLLHNERFSIESDSYRVTAKKIDGSDN